jgi:hypothetical protein
MGTTSLEASYKASIRSSVLRCHLTHHACAGKDIPAESNTIAIFDLIPLVLQRLEVHI